MPAPTQSVPATAEPTDSRSSPPARWDLVLRPRSRWLDLRLGDLWRYRDLVWLLVRRDFVSQYKQTLLGPLWIVLQPLLTTVVFVVIFGNIAGLGTDGLPKDLFYFSGQVVWGYYSAVLIAASNTFVGNANIFGKVYFPRLAVPLSTTLSTLIKFALQFGFFLAFFLFYWWRGGNVHFTSAAALLPVLVLIMAAQALGLGILFSAVTTKYRDLRLLLDFGVRLMMYATPAIFPLSSVSEEWRWVFLANPMTPVIETFRQGFLGAGTLVWGGLAYSAAFSFVALVVGTLLFHRVEKNFMDTV